MLELVVDVDCFVLRMNILNARDLGLQVGALLLAFSTIPHRSYMASMPEGRQSCGMKIQGVSRSWRMKSLPTLVSEKLEAQPGGVYIVDLE